MTCHICGKRLLAACWTVCCEGPRIRRRGR
jgi:hypothetical protein